MNSCCTVRCPHFETPLLTDNPRDSTTRIALTPSDSKQRAVMLIKSCHNILKLTRPEFALRQRFFAHSYTSCPRSRHRTTCSRSATKAGSCASLAHPESTFTPTLVRSTRFRPHLRVPHSGRAVQAHPAATAKVTHFRSARDALVHSLPFQSHLLLSQPHVPPLSPPATCV